MKFSANNSFILIFLASITFVSCKKGQALFFTENQLSFNRYIYQSQKSISTTGKKTLLQFGIQDGYRYNIHAILHYPASEKISFTVNKKHGLGINIASYKCTNVINGECSVIIKEIGKADYQIEIIREDGIVSSQTSFFIGIESKEPVTFANEPAQEMSQ